MKSEAYAPAGHATYPRPYGYKPHRHDHRGSSGLCGCLRCCCWCCSCCRCCIYIILFIIILLVGIGLVLYYLIKPVVPSYDLEQIDIKSFDIRKDDKLYTDVEVVVKAENPNKDIAMDYLENEVGIMYSGSQLCSGQIPPFLQPGKNTTTLKVEMKGESEFGAQMQNRLMEDEKLGKIPLLITVRLPIRFVIEDIVHLKKIVAKVNCSVLLDKLEPNKKPSILSKDFTYGVGF
ncbi:unnamed protein product [Sphenostylis stenocarpa]|uniref:Late embryogenesis abundant protein LEA-2 subgroup domain-containing protein n=1 Tax=Sphenostylis stenocarpa TaxID=92480 RepID=A0AA86SZE6_9FABA|nr:unnamed protein product [Sphenostylis stenocarpa]